MVPDGDQMSKAEPKPKDSVLAGMQRSPVMGLVLVNAKGKLVVKKFPAKSLTHLAQLIIKDSKKR
jgi:hypothetical protein